MSLTVLTSNPRKQSDNALPNSSDSSEERKMYRSSSSSSKRLVVNALRTGKWWEIRSLACACPPKASYNLRITVVVTDLSSRLTTLSNESSSPLLTVSRKTLRAPSTTKGGLIDENISGVPAGRHRTNAGKSATSTEGVRTQHYLSGENYKGNQQLEHQIPRNGLHVASQPTRNGVHLENTKKIQKIQRQFHLINKPWSCSASGAVAARRREIRNKFPRHENPYLDSDSSATP